MNKHEHRILADGDGVFSQEIIEVIRRYFVLLISVPVIVGLAAFVASSYLPKKYTSFAYLRMDRSTSLSFMTMATSPAVADKVLADYPDAGSTTESRVRYLNGHISMTDPEPLVDRSVMRTFRFDVTAGDARAAQDISTRLIDAFFPTTPSGQADRSFIEAELKRLKIATDADTALIDRLQKETSKQLIPASTLISSLIPRRDQNLAAFNATERKLAGSPRDIILSQPNLPQEPVRVGNGRAILAALVSIPVTLALLVVGRLLFGARLDRRLA